MWCCSVLLFIYIMSYCSYLYIRIVGWCCLLYVFSFKQKTAYEMRISDWSSDVCSSDLGQICINKFRVLSVTPKGYWISGEDYGFTTRWVSKTSPKIGRASCRERVCQYV